MLKLRSFRLSQIPEGGIPGEDETKPPSYRVLLLDGDEKVVAQTPLPVPDDVTAKAVARRMAKGVSAELWDGVRFIEHFDPDAAAS